MATRRLPLLASTCAALLMTLGCSDDDKPDGTDTKEDDLPAILDPQAETDEVVAALDDAFCKTEPLAVAQQMDHMYGGCSNAEGRLIQFRIFESERETTLYIENNSCQPGAYYARASRWMGWGITTTDAAAFEAAGAESLSCD